jgi:hypothetical protein
MRIMVKSGCHAPGDFSPCRGQVVRIGKASLTLLNSRTLLGLSTFVVICRSVGMLSAQTTGETSASVAPPARTAPDLGTVMPTAPSGFSGGAVSYPVGGGLGESILEGFSLAAMMTGRFDSNITQSPGEPIAPILDDFILSAGANLGYLSKAADWTFGGNYRGSYDSYFSNSDYSGYTQGAGAVVNYNGARLDVTGNVGADLNRGANRYYSTGFVEQTSVRSSVTARYHLSPKTSLQGNIGQSFTTTSGEGAHDTQSFDFGASALWKYSPLTEFGPGIRYTLRTGSSQLDRTSIGPTVTLNYKLSKKVTLNSRVGVDFASYEDGSTADPMISASIGMNYRASKLWGMNFSLYRDSQADQSTPGAFTEITAVRVGFNRKLHRAMLNLGLNYETNSTQYPGSNDVTRQRDYFSLDGSLGMAVLSNTTYVSLFMRYGDQSGDSTNDSWNSFQTGFSINRSF